MTDTGLFRVLDWDPDVLSDDVHGADEETFYTSLHHEIRYASMFCLASFRME